MSGMSLSPPTCWATTGPTTLPAFFCMSFLMWTLPCVHVRARILCHSLHVLSVQCHS